MALKLNTAPTAEPISLAEAKLHLRLDSEDLADDISLEQSIFPGDHAVASAYSLTGTGIDVLGYTALVQLESATNGTSGTVDVKIQESDNNSTWTDWTGGSFTQVTEANDNATYEKAYTGTKRYIRAVATVATATCDFGVAVIKHSYYGTTEDNLLTALITAARQYCENFQNRSYINTTWELWLDAFPGEDFISLPMAPLSSVTSVKYYSTANVEATFSAADYFVDTKSEPGRVTLGYGEVWPTTTLRPYNGVCVTYVSGYGASSSYVPNSMRQAMLLLIAHWYEHREAGSTVPVTDVPLAVESLLWQERVL